MELFADILLPLAFSGTLTYAVPARLASKVAPGMRVVVPLGKRKYYTGLIVSLRNEQPQSVAEVKPIADVLDSRPVLFPLQLKFWKWMADYYMCTQGEVMKAALPSGLKLESESVVYRNPDYCPDETLTDREDLVLHHVNASGGTTIDQLAKATEMSNVLPTVRRLVERGALRIEEKLTRAFRPRTETHVRLAPKWQSEEQLNELLQTLRRTPKQQQMLTTYLFLSEWKPPQRKDTVAVAQEVSKQKLLDESEGGDAVLSALRRKNILETYDFEVGRLRAQKARENESRPPLSEAQAQACREIGGVFTQKPVCLLHGVTSSGKTEIYIELIRHEIAAGRQVLFLLPEIALTTQIMNRLGRVFGEKMGVYHSKFPDAERVELWQRQCSDRAYSLILGVRSALFLPYRQLGLIIVDEEHETSYKQQDPAPRYQARDAAIVLAKMAGAKVLLGSATPSIESYYNATEAGKFGLVTLRQRYGNVCLPKVIVEDVKALRQQKQMTGLFSPRLQTEINRALSDGQQAILFFNRRGYAPVVECRACGWSPSCAACDVTLTYHQSMRRLVCHYCGASYDLPQKCPQCGERELCDVGYGTEKIAEMVQANFPDAKIARMDLDSTRSRAAYEQIIDDFQRRKTNLLVGTQMVTKGLDFEHVSVVGILNADQMLLQPDFRAYERAYQLMSQVAGRAGRRHQQGKVVLQTRQPSLPIIQQVVDTDYQALYGSQMAERRQFRYPPLVRIIGIFLKHRDENVCQQAALTLASMLRPHFAADLLGPDRPAVGRVQSLHIRKLMLKVVPSLPASGVRRTLTAAREALLAMPQFKSVVIYFDVDP